MPATERAFNRWNSGKLVILPYPVEYYYTRPPPVPESHFFELILLDSLHYMIGQLFPTYQSGAKLTCVIIVILWQVPALSPCRVPTPTVCDFVPWIVEANLAIKMRELVTF